jgi:hypothetical protein
VPRRIPEAEFEAIIDAVERHADGAAISQIEQDFPNLERRALQARVKKLVDAGRLRRQGQKRHSRYFSTRAPKPTDEHARSTSQPSLFVPLSTAGEEIRRAVASPPAARRPVGYDRGFLDEYEPNHTFYLSTEERTHLLSLGRSDAPIADAGTFARKILERLLIDLSWNSSRLEGNTYSLLDTARLVQLGREAEGKSARDAVMILNHKSAIEFLVESAGEVGFDALTIRNLHALLASDLLDDPSSPGRLRRIPVGIHGFAYQPISDPLMIEELFNTLLQKASAITDPFEQSFFAMVHLPYLQPFDDVNKRVSRLAANIPLIKANLAPLSFADMREDSYVSGLLGVYELRRIELLRDVFVWTYERSAARYAAQRQVMGEPDPFRIKWRRELQGVIGEVVRQRLTRAAASNRIQEWARSRAESIERDQLAVLAEAELLGLNEGNFARYRVRPADYYSWRQAWETED